MKSKFPKYGTREWRLFQYMRQLESRRGSNFQYYTDELNEDLERKGYDWWIFEDGKDYTISELKAKEIVEQLRKDGNYARIIAGKEKAIQRIKYFSICFKKK